MNPPYLHLDLVLEAVVVSADVDLQPAVAWFDRLVSRNAKARALDVGEGRPLIAVRVQCPCCGAGSHKLLPDNEGRRCGSCGTPVPAE